MSVGVETLDLLCVIARIEQIADLRANPTYTGPLEDLLLDRLVTCDAPRLRRYLSTANRALLDEVRLEVTPGGGSES